MPIFQIKKIYFSVKISKTIYFFLYEIIKDRLPYWKALYKRKLISIKKWLQSTDYKRMVELWSPLKQFIQAQRKKIIKFLL